MRQDRKEKLFFYKEGGGGYDEEKNKHTAPVTHKLEHTQIYKSTILLQCVCVRDRARVCRNACVFVINVLDNGGGKPQQCTPRPTSRHSGSTAPSAVPPRV